LANVGKVLYVNFKNHEAVSKARQPLF
jgi:hypothetical protein